MLYEVITQLDPDRQPALQLGDEIRGSGDLEGTGGYEQA